MAYDTGAIAVASSKTQDSLPPLVMDVIPAHSQAGFDKDSGIPARSIITMFILQRLS